CSKGLYGFSSNGQLGTRTIELQIEFALNGTNDWRSYNDLNYVDSHEVVGGSELATNPVSFYASFAPTVYRAPDTALSDDYYEVDQIYNSFTRGLPVVTDSYIKAGTNKLILTPNVYPLGSKIFYGSNLLGVVESVDTFTAAPNIIVT